MLPQRSQLLSKEGRLSLAITTLKSNPHYSMRHLTASYNVPESTLRTRLRGTQSKHETTLFNLKISPEAEKLSL
jgi:hypothetical protein